MVAGIAVGRHDGWGLETDSSYLWTTRTEREPTRNVMKLLKLQSLTSVMHSSHKSPSPKPFQTVPMTWDQEVKCLNLMEDISFKSPHFGYFLG